MHIPDLRVRLLNSGEVNRSGDYVLYWMTMFRRMHYNFALEEAVGWAKELRKPLVVLEALRYGYRWASDRIHRFVIEGMAANEKSFANTSAYYYPFLETEDQPGRRSQGEGLVEALAERASVVITDDFPCFFIPAMLRWMGPRIPVRFEAIDSNGLLPMRAAERDYPTAYAFRRFLHHNLAPHLEQLPKKNPLARSNLPQFSGLPSKLLKRWPRGTAEQLSASPKFLASLPIDHQVKSATFSGGSHVAQEVSKRFLDERLEKYGEERNEPQKDGASGLSPYLHFGHISVHEVFAEMAQRESWSPAQLAGKKATGQREGWWSMSASAESFLDELVTWRELGYNFCSHRRDYDRYESLPGWARKSLDDHAKDKRTSLYSPEQFERAETHDQLWNAAQNQLVREGRMHNYLRMLWGKKILEWSASPQEALRIMVNLNNKYAVDGRNPNSYSGIFWCLGRFDRPWAPERPIFGCIRYMSSDNTAKKFRVKDYIARYNGQPELF
jgi:deoxyribodipyrimidine photo-lyase